MAKLLYITNGINGAGGLERVLSIKASILAEKFGYEVAILTLNGANKNLFYDFSTRIKLCDIAVSGNPISYIKTYFSGINKVVKEIKPDIILVCDDGLKGFLLSFIFAKKIPIIYERHVSKNISMEANPNFFDIIKTKIQFKLMDYFGAKFDAFVVLTQQNKSEWKSNNIKVIPNPLTFYPDQIASQVSKKVIAVGKQSYQKGYDRLLLSWKQVVEKYPDWHLEIYGTFDASQPLEKLASELQIANSIHFFKPVKNIDAKYLAASIFALSSRYEGFGMVIIEAMACGLPCVSFDCPYGPADIIQDGKDGFLVENGDTNQFAKKLLELIEDKENRSKMGKAAKENVKRFLPENVIGEWDKLFKSLLS